jgi:predicted nucleotidyltransferase
MASIYELVASERARIRHLLAAELAREQDVAFAYLYGSFAESQSFRDIDIGVYLVGQANPSERQGSLTERLSSLLKMPADVRVLNDAPVTFLYHVLRGELLCSRDDLLLSAVMEDTFRRYLDIAPLLRHSTKEAFAK